MGQAAAGDGLDDPEDPLELPPELLEPLELEDDDALEDAEEDPEELSDFALPEPDSDFAADGADELEEPPRLSVR